MQQVNLGPKIPSSENTSHNAVGPLFRTCIVIIQMYPACVFEKTSCGFWWIMKWREPCDRRMSQFFLLVAAVEQQEQTQLHGLSVLKAVNCSGILSAFVIMNGFLIC